MTTDADVIIVGAGVAGLAALKQLTEAGVSAVCLEARDRIGGRILTVRDPQCPIPVELGAEFIHGRPPEVWEIVARGPLCAYDCTEHSVHFENGHIVDRSDAWLPVDEVMEDMEKAAASGPDRSFLDFVKSTKHAESAKQLATNYVQGFNAARADEISIQALTDEGRAANSIEGDRAFRIVSGYDAVASFLCKGRIELNTAVNAVRGNTVETNKGTLRTKRVLVTVPLGVLQANTIRFDPEPTDVLHAAGCLRFGQVVRVVLQFKDRVYENRPDLTDVGFLLSGAPEFPTWWTPLPVRAPIMTGWSSGPKADGLLALDEEQVLTRAVEALKSVAGLGGEVQRGHYHNWHADPFARGAYSYVPAGANWARRAMTVPFKDILFFAGEATEHTGHAATVHGAIRSGRRAADQILRTLRHAGPTLSER